MVRMCKESTACMTAPSGDLKNVDVSGTNLGHCEGDCDADADCKSGLKCFQRDGYTAVPGCVGRGTSGWDFCIAADDMPIPCPSGYHNGVGCPTAFPAAQCCVAGWTRSCGQTCASTRCS